LFNELKKEKKAMAEDVASLTPGQAVKLKGIIRIIRPPLAFALYHFLTMDDNTPKVQWHV